MGCSVHVRENSTVGYMLNVRRNNGRRCECELTTARELCTRRAVCRRASHTSLASHTPNRRLARCRETRYQCRGKPHRNPPQIAEHLQKKKRSSDIARESDCDAYKRPILRSDTTHTHTVFHDFDLVGNHATWETLRSVPEASICHSGGVGTQARGWYVAWRAGIQCLYMGIGAWRVSPLPM